MLPKKSSGDLENNSTGNSTVSSINQELVKLNDTQAFPSAILSEELAVWGLLQHSGEKQYSETFSRHKFFL